MNSFSWKPVTKVICSIAYLVFTFVVSIGVYFSGKWIVMQLFFIFVSITGGSVDWYIRPFAIMQLFLLLFSTFVYSYAIKALIQVYKTSESSIPVFGKIAIFMLVRD
ncbi:MAG: hypothetical protein FWG88_09995 [Oscillospiraceae bacterium]|nr:hypothetical protein [Oscillospiraceae bacterium]